MADPIPETTKDIRRCGTCDFWYRAEGNDGDCIHHAVPVPSISGTECPDWVIVYTSRCQDCEDYVRRTWEELHDEWR